MLNGTNFACSNYFWFFAVDTMGGGDSRFQVTGVIEGFLGGLKFSILGFFWSVFHLRGDFFCVFKTI